MSAPSANAFCQNDACPSDFSDGKYSFKATPVVRLTVVSKLSFQFQLVHLRIFFVVFCVSVLHYKGPEVLYRMYCLYRMTAESTGPSATL